MIAPSPDTQIFSINKVYTRYHTKSKIEQNLHITGRSMLYVTLTF